MRTLAFTLLVALLAGCPAPTEPVVDAAVAATSPRFVAGELHRYRFAWRVDASSREVSLADSIDLRGGVDMAGVLDVRVYGERPEGWVLGCSFGELDRHALLAMGHDVLAEPAAAAQLRGHEALLVIDARGERAPQVRFDASSPSVFRHLMAGLLVHLDLQPVADGTAIVPVAHGLAEVAYVRDPQDASRARRELTSFVRFDAKLADVQPDVAIGEATITFDDRGLPVRIDATEALSLPGPMSDAPGFTSRAEVSLARERTESFAIDVVPALEGGILRDLAAAPDEAEAQRELSRRFAEGLTLSELAMEVQGVDHGLRAPRGLISRATGLLQAEPLLAADVGEMFTAVRTAHARGFVLDMLASAGTPEAQTVMIAALRHPGLRNNPELARLLQRLTFLPEPTREMVHFAIDVHERAAASGDRRLHAAIAYPLGSLARRVDHTDPALAEVMRERLRDHLSRATDDDARVAALAGIGNAGAPEDLDLVLAHVESSSGAVRMQAASSLRFFDDASARAALFDLATDRTPEVAMLALSTMDVYALPDDDLATLARLAKNGEIAPDATTSLVNVLSRHRDRDPALDDALRAILDRETDLHRKIRLERLLGLRRA